MNQTLFSAQERGVDRYKLADDVLRWWYRFHYRGITIAEDLLTREVAQLYVGLEAIHCKAEFRDVCVPRYFKSRLTKLNCQREQQDRDALEWRRKIEAIRKRTYASRAFPSSLRAIIFERDNYTCRTCMRDRKALSQVGFHLECDHIVAWEDGGLTTYDNGQTLCSECNKAKHHTKHYFGLMTKLRGQQASR
jgi:5-methylcytosine-specific restriction endonuclease McrA